MKIKKVLQYTCDFCGKKKYTKSSAVLHEKHCTSNPNRECRMCIYSSGARGNLSELIKLLPDISNRKSFQDNTDLISDLKTIYIPKLQEASDNCPACIWAALKQSGIAKFLTGQMKEIYDFRKEMQEIFNEMREEGLGGMNYDYS